MRASIATARSVRAAALAALALGAAVLVSAQSAHGQFIGGTLPGGVGIGYGSGGGFQIGQWGGRGWGPGITVGPRGVRSGITGFPSSTFVRPYYGGIYDGYDGYYGSYFGDYSSYGSYPRSFYSYPRIVEPQIVQPDYRYRQFPTDTRLQTWIGQRGSLGITVDDRFGHVRVNQVYQNGAGATAGLQTGDEIVAIGGRPIRTHAELVSELRAAAEADTPVEMQVRRNGALMRIAADVSGQAGERLAVRPQMRDQTRYLQPQVGARGGLDAAAQQQARAGAAESGRLGVTVFERGERLFVRNVTEGSAAAHAGLESGDEILAINGRRIGSHGELTSHLRTAGQANGRVELTIHRDGALQQIAADLSGRADVAARQQVDSEQDVQPPEAIDRERYAERPRVLPERQAPRGVRPDGQGISGLRPQPDTGEHELLGVTITDTDPLRITQVAQGSAAARAQFQVGDEILSVNEQRVFSRDQFHAALQAAALIDPEVSLLIRRGEEQMRVTVNLSGELKADHEAEAESGTDAPQDAPQEETPDQQQDAAEEPAPPEQEEDTPQ